LVTSDVPGLFLRASDPRVLGELARLLAKLNELSASLRMAQGVPRSEDERLGE
jgi:hypothetical protein